MTDLTTERATDGPGPGDPSDAPFPTPRPPADPPFAPAGGVELSRLLALARLTPAQALEIGASVLAAAAAQRSAPDAGSAGSDQLTVLVGADGQVVLGDAVDGRRDGGPPAVGALLADVAGATGKPRRADPAADPLTAELDRAVAELPVAGVPAVAVMLQEAATAIDRVAVRAEIAALVRAVEGRAAPGRGTGPAGAPPTAARAVPAGRAPRRRTGTARRRIGAWLLSILVLGGVVLLEVAVLRDKVVTDIGLLLDAGRSGSTPSAAPKPDGLPVVPPAPAAAGSVRGVDLRPLAPCAPGAPCTVRLLVRVVPGAAPQAVTWTYRLVDRCTGATTTAPGGSVTVPARGERAAVVGTVPLPATKAVGVVAVTQAPAAAASSPVLVGSCRSRTG